MEATVTTQNSSTREGKKAHAPALPQEPQRVLVFDNYGTRMVDIDGDLIPDITHGKAVEAYLKEQGELRTKGFDTDRTAGRKEAFRYFRDKVFVYAEANERHIGEMNKVIQKGTSKLQPGDAINLSQGIGISFEELSGTVGFRVTRDNIASKREKVLAALHREATTGDPEGHVAQISAGGSWIYLSRQALANTLRTNELLEQAAAKGHIVAVAAGNEGKDSVNLFSLARGVDVVAALNSRGEVEPYSCYNSLVTHAAQGTYFTSLHKGGVDITGDTIPDVAWKKTTTQGKHFDKDAQEIPQKALKELEYYADKRMRESLAKHLSKHDIPSGTYRLKDLVPENVVNSQFEDLLVEYKSRFGVSSVQYLKSGENEKTVSEVPLQGEALEDFDLDWAYPIEDKDLAKLLSKTSLAPGLYKTQALHQSISKNIPMSMVHLADDNELHDISQKIVVLDYEHKRAPGIGPRGGTRKKATANTGFQLPFGAVTGTSFATPSHIAGRSEKVEYGRSHHQAKEVKLPPQIEKQIP